MAIRKDLDDMLNNLKANRAPKPLKKAEKPAAPPTVHAKSKFDDMSVDDLLSALADDTTTQEMQKITETTASVYEANRKTADQLHQELLQREEEKRQAVEAARRAEIDKEAVFLPVATPKFTSKQELKELQQKYPTLKNAVYLGEEELLRLYIAFQRGNGPQTDPEMLILQDGTFGIPGRYFLDNYRKKK